MEQCAEQLRAVHTLAGASLQRKSRGSRGSTAWDEPGRTVHDSIAWISQQKVNTRDVPAVRTGVFLQIWKIDLSRTYAVWISNKHPGFRCFILKNWTVYLSTQYCSFKNADIPFAKNLK